MPVAPLYDVIVIGLGAMGSAALDQLARRGASVLGLEQFGIPHEHGSSGGDTRLIRKAYFEHPDYVPLLHRAYANWDDLGARTGERVLYRTGAVYIGRPDSELIAGSLASARQHSLPCDRMSGGDATRRWSGLRVPDGYEALHEADGGFVLAGKSIRLQCECALRRGAHVRAAEAVLEWRETASGIEVVTSAGTYRAAHLIVTVGSWAGAFLPRLGTPLEVTRQALFWVWPARIAPFELDAFPCWAAQLDGHAGLFYGFPMLPVSMGGQLGFKIAHHAKGLQVEPGGAWPVDVTEFASVREALREIFVDDLGPVVATKACMYTSTTDGHFVVDRYPDSERVTVACGFSGHGFKFASVIGEALADLALEGRTELPIGFLGLERFRDDTAAGEESRT
jgi:sarcosine oxidase